MLLSFDCFGPLQILTASRHALKLRTLQRHKEYLKQREELVKTKREARANGEWFSVLLAFVFFDRPS